MEKLEILEKTISQKEKSIETIEKSLNLLDDTRKLERLSAYPALTEAILDNIYSNLCNLLYTEKSNVKEFKTEYACHEAGLKDFAEELHSQNENRECDENDKDDLPF